MNQHLKNYSEKLNRALSLDAMNKVPELGVGRFERRGGMAATYTAVRNGGSSSRLSQVELWFASKAMT